MKNIKNLTGLTFGYLKIIEFSHTGIPSKGGGKRSFWKCKCKCGKIIIKNSKYLQRSKNLASCGCKILELNKEKFFQKVKITEDCWEWTGYVNPAGYGSFSNKKLAHRYMFEHFNGKIPKGICCLHHCDNRICCNPSHIFLGTRTDNSRDKVEKNRQGKGSKMNKGKLVESQVLEIRKMRISEKKYREIADEFNISQDLVKIICKNKSWKHVELGEKSKLVKPQNKNRIPTKNAAKLNENDVKDIKYLISIGKRGADLARKYNVTKTTISDIKHKRSWKDV